MRFSIQTQVKTVQDPSINLCHMTEMPECLLVTVLCYARYSVQLVSVSNMSAKLTSPFLTIFTTPQLAQIQQSLM